MRLFSLFFFLARFISISLLNDSSDGVMDDGVAAGMSQVMEGQDDVDILADGSWIVTGSSSNRILLWDVLTGTSHDILSGRSSQMGYMALHRTVAMQGTHCNCLPT